MNISITLVHNKTPQENEAQVSTLKSFLTEVVDGPFTNPETGETWTTIHHEIIGLNIPHTVKVYQAVPFDKELPPNAYEINSGGIVNYLNGDEDKLGNHPRFFNWGLKRVTDNGADISVYIDNLASLSIPRARQALQKFTNDTEFVEAQFGKLASLKLLKQVGKLKEDRSLTDSFNDLKQRVIQKGMKNG